MTAPVASRTPPPDSRPPSTPPPDNRPPNKPPSSPPPTSPPPTTSLADDLEHAELLLLTIGRLSMDRFGALDPALHHQLNTGLRTALRAVSAAQNSGRDGEVAVRGGRSRPVQLRAGRPPLPGAGYPAEPCGASLSARCFNGEPGCRTHPRPVPWCGAARELGGQRPCPIKEPCREGRCLVADDAEPDDFDLPTWPGTEALMASLARRAD